MGGFIGIALAWICLWQFHKKPDKRVIPVLEPAEYCSNGICSHESTMGAFIVEMVCSFFFIAIILMVKDPVTAPSKEGYLCCWTVGVTLLGQICLAGGRSGAALNPAVGLCVNIFDGWQL